MTNLIRIAALLAIVAASSTAQAKIQALGDCYNVVIAACNQKANPYPCANNGMDQCDKEFDKAELAPPRKAPGLKAN